MGCPGILGPQPQLAAACSPGAAYPALAATVRLLLRHLKLAAWRLGGWLATLKVARSLPKRAARLGGQPPLGNAPLAQNAQRYAPEVRWPVAWPARDVGPHVGLRARG